MHLDDDRLEELRRWGDRLRGAGGAEQAAAGRAILLLIEEVEGLRLELTRTRELWARVNQEAGAATKDTEQALAPTHTGSATQAESETRAPEAWIKSLRRQR